MNCDTFDRWLDGGAGPALDSDARAHAAACVRCAAALRAFEQVDALLGAPSAPLPAGFVDCVMARVEAERPAAVALIDPALSEPAMPWWAAAAMQPAIVAALALAALVLWAGGGLIAGSVALANAIAAATTSWSATTLVRPDATLAVAFAAGIGIAAVTWALYAAPAVLARRMLRVSG